MVECDHILADITEERFNALGELPDWFKKYIEEDKGRGRVTISRLRLGEVILLKCSECDLLLVKDK